MERKGKGAVQWLQCGGAVLLGWCWCAAAELLLLLCLSLLHLAWLAVTAWAGACYQRLALWGFNLLDWKMLLFLGGLHSPCDNYSFLANVYCLRTKERRVLTGQLLLSAVKSCWNQLCLNARWCRRLYSQMYFLLSNIARYLVDPASSHMLVSKIKPCMSKYKPE